MESGRGRDGSTAREGSLRSPSRFAQHDNTFFSRFAQDEGKTISFSAYQADAGGESAAFAGGEGGLRVGGIDDVVDYERIAAAVNVVEAAAEGQIVAEKVKTLFQLDVEREIVGETLGAGCADELLLVGEQVVGESSAGFEGVGDFKLMDDGQLEQREVSPGEEAVGCVPRIGAGLLRAQNGAIDVEVEGLIGVGAGAGVGAHQQVGFAEVVAERNLQGMVMILARVLKEVVSVGSVVEGVVDESVGAAAVEKLGLQIDCGGEFFFERKAPVEGARGLQRATIDGEGTGHRAGGGDAVRDALGIRDRIKNILACAGEGAGDQEDGSGVVDEADAGGEFGVAGTIENIGSGEPGREDGVADDFIPVEAYARRDQQAVGEEPAIFGVGADFGVELLMPRRGAEGGVASARKFCCLRSRQAEVRRSQRVVSAEE